MFSHCKHCPRSCQAEHDAPPEVYCADCAVAYEEYLEALSLRVKLFLNPHPIPRTS